MLKKLARYVNPFSLLASLSAERQVCAVPFDNGRYLIVASDFYPISWPTVADRSLTCSPCNKPVPFSRGIVAVVSYDDFSPTVTDKQLSLFFKIDDALIFDLHQKIVWQSGNGTSFNYLLPAVNSSRSLTIEEDKEDNYLATVRQIIDDIADGRYYLLNFLRFFRLVNSSHQQLVARLNNSDAGYRAVIRYGTTAIYSFSPERFVSLKYHDGKTQLSCSPIKGTVACVADRDRDLAAQRWLMNSEKDLAELHITIDLARNDINTIAHTTRVTEPAHLQSFATVHHLVARIEATLHEGVTFGELLTALCPAASISGAPKREVMQAIASYEKQRRGFCMGNIFCLDQDSGQLDSSVLIRTIDGNTCAVGGGVTLASDPEQEQDEITAKLRFLTAT